MTIEVEDGKEIGLTLQYVLHTPGLYSNLISIPKIYNMGLNVVFDTNDVVTRLDNRCTVIQDM